MNDENVIALYFQKESKIISVCVQRDADRHGHGQPIPDSQTFYALLIYKGHCRLTSNYLLLYLTRQNRSPKMLINRGKLKITIKKLLFKFGKALFLTKNEKFDVKNRSFFKLLMRYSNSLDQKRMK